MFQMKIFDMTLFDTQGTTIKGLVNWLKIAKEEKVKDYFVVHFLLMHFFSCIVFILYFIHDIPFTALQCIVLFLLNF